MCLPVILGFAGLVIDVGNWFEHRRHLQTQADAAVLAAAGDARFPCDASVDSAINSRIEEYGKTRNPQVGGTPPERVEWLLNSERWPRQDGVDDPIDTTVVEGSACEARMIDVKMTEHDLPWFLDFTGLVDHINVRARVSLFAITRRSGALPVGVPDVNPEAVRVWFVDETTSPPTTIPGSAKLLKRRKDANGDPVFENGLQIWDNAVDNGGTALPLAVESQRIGMRVALSRDPATTDCAEPVVECFDATSANGLLFVRGHATTPAVVAGSEPELRDAWLLPGTCTDGYFSMSTAACAVQLNARIDLAPDVTAPTVEALAGGKAYPMTFDAVDGMWKSGVAIPVPAGTSVAVDVRVRQRNGSFGATSCTSSSPCERTFTNVQRHTSASDPASGPIRQLVVSNSNGTGANSLERCTAVQTACTHDLVVRVGLLGGIQYASSATSPPIALRVAGGGSQNQSLDCDPNLPKLQDEIRLGCAPTYALNRAEPCPAGANDLWASPQPWRCVAIQTGAAVNQVPAGMNARILGDEKAKTCTAPNQWPAVLSNPLLMDSDPRLVPVFVTPYGSFSGSGSGTVPVRNFAYFYVTGWAGSGGGFSNPCEAFGDDLVPQGAGYIIGHFVKYVARINDGSSGDTPCDFRAASPCVAVMTD
jgi:Putative Flp pilus-assembly TadE/G-like